MKNDLLMNVLSKVISEKNANSTKHSKSAKKNDPKNIKPANTSSDEQKIVDKNEDAQFKIIKKLVDKLGIDVKIQVIKNAINKDDKSNVELQELGKLFDSFIKITDKKPIYPLINSLSLKNKDAEEALRSLESTSSTDTPNKENNDDDVLDLLTDPSEGSKAKLKKLSDNIEIIINQEFGGDKDKFKKFVQDELAESINSNKNDFLTESQIRAKIRNTILKNKGKQ
jgi:hypothetical protein